MSPKEDLASRRRRLRMAASRRGSLEVELALEPLVRAGLDDLDQDALDGLERLLAMEDLDLWEVLAGRRPAPEGVEPDLLARLRGPLGRLAPGA